MLLLIDFEKNLGQVAIATGFCELLEGFDHVSCQFPVPSSQEKHNYDSERRVPPAWDIGLGYWAQGSGIWDLGSGSYGIRSRYFASATSPIAQMRTSATCPRGESTSIC